jgi:prephenate dehydrogenase
MTVPELPPHVGIVGLGLMGGSLARDLVARGVRVTAFDRDAALTGPAADGIHLVTSARDVMGAPVIVLAVPVNASVHLLAELGPRSTPAHTLLDVGSTKANLAAHAEALGIGDRFVGCHPLAGDHRSGWSASRAGLFQGATIFVCPSATAAPRAVSIAESLWTGVGGIVEFDDAAAHDRRMALASHLPHMLSVALALTLCEAGVPHAVLGPGGRDVARLAGGSPEMWSDIVIQNRPALTEALEHFERRLGELRRAIGAGADDDVRPMLTSARVWHAG